MPAPKKANSSLSRTMSSNKKVVKPAAQSSKPTTTVDAKVRLMNKKTKMDEGRASVKSGNATQNIAYKKQLNKNLSVSDRNKANALRKEGYVIANAGKKTLVETAQSYGEASRTNRRVQAQAKRKTK